MGNKGGTMRITKEIHDMIDAQAQQIDYGRIILTLNASASFVGVTTVVDAHVPIPREPEPGIIAETNVKHEG